MVLFAFVLPLNAADTYWTARAAYMEARESGDLKALVAAVKRIEAVYSSPADVTEHERLCTPRIHAANAYEAMGQFSMAAEYYRRALENVEAIRALENSDRFFDYTITLPELIRHNEKTPTVYAETTDLSNIPYFGAVGETEAGTVQGMCLDKADEFDPSFHSAHLLYVQFFNEDIGAFSWKLNDKTDDYTLLVGWNVPNENKADLDRINSGESDDYIIENLKYLDTLNCNVLLRFGAEVNCWASLPSVNGSDKTNAAEFIEAYKNAFIRISKLADQYSPNVGMVYSPNSVSNWYYNVEDFYPGDEYVDWVGMSAYYNKTEGDSWSISSGTDAFYSRGDYYDDPILKIEHIVEAFGDRKPIIITEGGCCYESSDGVQSVEYAEKMLSYFYTYVSRVYPQVKGVMYFNNTIGGNSYTLFAKTGANDYLASVYTDLVRSNVAMEYRLGNTNVCGYTEITNIDEVTDSLRLSVFATYPTTDDIMVNYYLDGDLVKESNSYPYDAELDMKDLSVGGHFLKVKTTCMETTCELYYKVNVSESGKITVSDAIPESVDDVPQDYWGRESVAFGMARGLFNGTSATKFSPLGDVSRAMFVTILARLSEYDPDAYSGTSFDDVKEGEWYSAAVEWASSYGIVKGTGNRSFSPNDPISRQDMCVIMVRYCSIFGITLESPSGDKFNDDAKISDYAKDAVYIARSAGIVTGASGNMFNPKNTASRAEAAAVFMRFMINFVNR